MFVAPRDVDVGVLTRLEIERCRCDRLKVQRDDVPSHRDQGGDTGAHVLDGDAAEEFVLVEVQQLDRAVAVCMRFAQQHIPFLHLGVVTGERGVVSHLDVALEDIGFAGRTAALPAAVHEVDALTERCIEDVLVLGYLDLDADGFEVDAV